jgi:hypothetical protein
MKNVITLLLSVFVISNIAFAQNPLSKVFQVDYSLGYVIPFLQKGKELLHAEHLRENQQSYFEDVNGNRANVGDYPRLDGYSFSIAFFKPVKWAKGLMLGSVVRNSQTGSKPSKGKSAEAYYFNFITSGIALKYYPFEKVNLYATIDFGMSAVLTKNRFLNANNKQNFFHQFGVGSCTSLGVGYSLRPFKKKDSGFDLQVTYQHLATRVEVNDIGDDKWRFGALHITASTNY